MLWSRPDNMSAEIDLEWLLKVMPPAEAKLYRVLIRMIPAPSAESTVAASRRIQMAELARRTGWSKRWVITLLQRLEEKDLIQTEGGSGAVKWIRLLPLGVPRIGPTRLTQKEATGAAPRPGKAKAPRVAASRPKLRRKETAQSTKPDADIKVELPAEKPAEIPARRRQVPMPSIPPADPAPDYPVVLATTVILPPLPVPAGPTLSAPVMPPPPASTRQGGLAARRPRVRAAKIAPQLSTAPGVPAPSNPMVAAATLTPAPSVVRGPAPGSPVAPAATVTPPPPSTGPGGPAPGNPTLPAAMALTPPPATAPRISAKPIPPAPPPRPGAPIEDLVAYTYRQPVTSDLIWSLKTAVGNEHRLRIALQILCQRRHRYEQESNLKSAIRSALNDYL